MGERRWWMQYIVFAQRHNTFPADASCLIRCIVHGKAYIVHSKAYIVLGMYGVGLVLLIPLKRASLTQQIPETREAYVSTSVPTRQSEAIVVVTSNKVKFQSGLKLHLICQESRSKSVTEIGEISDGGFS
jgi:hypothetical protein